MQAATKRSPGPGDTTTIFGSCKSRRATGLPFSAILEQVLVLVGRPRRLRLLCCRRHQVALAVVGDGFSNQQFSASPALVGHLALRHQLVDERDRALKFGGSFTDGHSASSFLSSSRSFSKN